MIFLAVVSAYDTVGASAETLYFSNNGFKSGPSDTPASQYFEPRIKQAASMRRDAFGPGRTFGRSTVGVGDLVLNNPDGDLDYLLDYAFDGRAVEVYAGDDDATAFPADFEPLVVATAEQAEFSRTLVKLKLRDRQLELDVPIQTTLYAGTNALPAGLEGVADLKGKPKPKCFGTVRNIAPPCVNTSKMIYQVNDGAVSGVDGIYDSGILLSDSTSLAFEGPTADSGELAAHYVSSYAYSPTLRLFVAGMTTGYTGLASSNDGRFWTPRGESPTTGQTDGNGVAWAAGKFVAVLDRQGVSTPTLVTSSDGVVWTEQTTPCVGGDYLYDVCYSDDLSLWCAVGGDFGASPGIVLTSSNGATWTARTGAFTAGEAGRKVVWAAGAIQLFVCVSVNGGEIMTSPDGTTWTARTNPMATPTPLRYLAYSPDLDFLVASCDTAKTILTSPDGINWTERTVAAVLTGSWIRGLYWSDHLQVFLANGANPAGGDGVLYSADGINWAFYGSGLSSAYPFIEGNGALMAGTYRSNMTYDVYASEADLLDDALAPPPGSAGIYLAGGYIRLGSTPAGLVTADVTQGTAAADRTAAKGLEWALEAGGMVNLAHLITSDDVSGWSSTGTPAVVAAADPWGGTDAWKVTDDDPASVEQKYLAVTFVGDGAKSFEIVVKEETMPAAGVQTIGLYDATATAWRAQAEITSWVAGEPQITAAVGTLVRLRRVRPGHYVIRFASTSVTAASNNRFVVEPASTLANTGSIRVYKPRVYNTADPEAHDWSWLDVLRMDHDNDAVTGFWSGLETINCSDVASKFAESIGAWWGVDRTGTFRTAVFGDPTGETATVEFTADDMVKPLERVSTADPGHGIPIWRSVIRFDRNYTVQSSDLAAGVSDATRGLLAREWKEESDDTAAVKTAYLLAREQIDETLLTASADALAEATRRLTLRDSRRDPLEFTVPLTMDTVLVDFDDFAEITHGRFGLTAGKVFGVITIEPDAAARVVTLRVWG